MPDSADPLFFLSYAHSPNSRPVAKFFDDLSETIADLVDLRAGADPGFMDRSIQSGGRWTGALLRAVGTCQVFVALLSAPYLTSQWCSMEWYAFAQRKIVIKPGGSDDQTAIIPVIWAPWPTGMTVPGAVGAVQQFTPDGLPDPKIAKLYRSEGVLGLTKVAKDAYEPVVWRLARQVVNIAYNHEVEPCVLRQSDLRDVFQESQ